MCWAVSTLKLYNGYVNKFQEYCHSCNVSFPTAEPAVVADFMCLLSDNSTRPKSAIQSASAALSHLFQALGVKDPLHSTEMQHLLTALIKSGTTEPRKRRPILPIEPFRIMFHSWPENKDISIKLLRMKAITLLALAYMLRPSDLAPTAVWFDPESGEQAKFILSVENVNFEADGSLTMTFHGIKNDTAREGFKVTIPASSESALDPVQCLKTYISRTEHLRSRSQPLFLKLTKPYDAISAATVGNIL